MGSRAPDRASTRPLAGELRLLAASSEAACVVDREGVILFVNEGWERFAAENGGGMGCRAEALVATRWLDHVRGDEPGRLHRRLLERVLAGHGTGPRRSIVQVSESNGPTTARLVATRLEPIHGRTGEIVGAAVVHRVARELPIAEVYPVLLAPDAGYRDGAGHVVQCSCCRRTRRPAEPDDWDFVANLVERPPDGVRYAYCDLCLELHYPGGADVRPEDGLP